LIGAVGGVPAGCCALAKSIMAMVASAAIMVIDLDMGSSRKNGSMIIPSAENHDAPSEGTSQACT
jgi:hypothetical protein